jgi:prophage regulatory protein
MQTENTRPKGIAREPQRYQLTGVPTSTWYDLQNAGLAPKPIPLGPRSRGWLIEELDEWVNQRRAQRDAGDAWQTLGDTAARVVAKVTKRVKP